jgi:hypothetical protein
MRHFIFGGSDDDFFVSGDYSAATDGLDIRLTKIFLEAALDRLHPDDQPFRQVLSSNLYEQILWYSEKEFAIQRNGQLMGSVLSFPFLCLANLFAYVLSLPDPAWYCRAPDLLQKIRKLPVLINGDDILFRSDPVHYRRWQSAVGQVGFRLSQGKNFTHPQYFTVNSVPIHYRRVKSEYQTWKSLGLSWADIEEAPPVSQTPHIEIYGFLNVGLLTGISKLTGREDLHSLPLSGWYSASVCSALNPPQAHKWFLKYHRKEIQSQTQFGSETLNIFAHPLLGGLGFPVPPGLEPRFSPAQRRIARALYLSALYTFEGQEKDFSLPSLLYVKSNSPGTTFVAHAWKRAEVQMYPTGLPLPSGASFFNDSSGVSPVVMSQDYSRPIPDDALDSGPRPSCRLTSNRIRQLVREFGEYVVDLHPLDEMTTFPFVPISLSDCDLSQVRVSRRRWELIVVPAIRLYVPEIIHQDVPVSQVPLPGDLVDSDDMELCLPVTPLEDWETQDIRLVSLRLSEMEVEPPSVVTPEVPVPKPDLSVTVVDSVRRYNKRNSSDIYRENFMVEDPSDLRPHGYVFSRKGGRFWR